MNNFKRTQCNLENTIVGTILFFLINSYAQVLSVKLSSFKVVIFPLSR